MTDLRSYLLKYWKRLSQLWLWSPWTVHGVFGEPEPGRHPGPEPGRLDDLADDERVEDDDGRVGQYVRQHQLAPDDVEGDIQVILSHLGSGNDDSIGVRISGARDLEELGEVEDDREHGRERDEPPVKKKSLVMLG